MLTAQIIDVSHHNGDVDFDALRRAGVLAVIAKATQGTRFVDPRYAGYRKAATQLGLLWGAYHFGTCEPVADQLDHFLATADLRTADLACLDFEENTSAAASMTAEQALQFVQGFKSRMPSRGYPVLYGGAWLKQLLNGKPYPGLSNCPLWLAQYGPHAELPPGWSAYKLWQHVEGRAGGTGLDRFDSSLFDGTQAQLRAEWPFSGAVASAAPGH